MKQLPFYYCYFSFRDGGLVHDLRVRVTPSIGLEWHLYRDHEEIASLSHSGVNILIPEQLAAALSYSNVLKVYADLLAIVKPTTGTV